MKKSAYNPYGIHGKEELFRKLTLLSTWGAALVGSLLFFPFLQVIRGNSWPSFLYDLWYYLSELVSAAALFTVFALGVVATVHEEKALKKKLFRREAYAILSLTVAARLFLYWLGAFLDSKLRLPFHFSDVTLSYLTNGNGFRLAMQTFSSLVNFGLTLVMILLVFRFVEKSYEKGERGKKNDRMLRLPAFVYLGVSLVSAVVNTVLTVIDYGISADPSVIISLILPYVEIAAVTLLGYYYLPFAVGLFEE